MSTASDQLREAFAPLSAIVKDREPRWAYYLVLAAQQAAVSNLDAAERVIRETTQPRP